jgi:hypothetical protein
VNVYGDDYWDDDYDWDSVWGDYACEDLFDTDLEGLEYDAQYAPGNDGYPFVYIYGSCSKCEAYLVDYYATEHFQDIKNYQTQGFKYAMCAIISLAVTAVFAVKQRLRPAQSNEVVLLTN